MFLRILLLHPIQWSLDNGNTTSNRFLILWLWRILRDKENTSRNMDQDHFNTTAQCTVQQLLKGLDQPFSKTFHIHLFFFFGNNIFQTHLKVIYSAFNKTFLRFVSDSNNVKKVPLKTSPWVFSGPFLPHRFLSRNHSVPSCFPLSLLGFMLRTAPAFEKFLSESTEVATIPKYFTATLLPLQKVRHWGRDRGG